MQQVQNYLGKMRGGAGRPTSPPIPSVLLAGTGAAVAIAATAGLSDMTGATLLMAPFGAPCFLAFAAPDSPPAQPRHSPGTAPAQPRHSPGTAPAQPRHSPGTAPAQPRHIIFGHLISTLAGLVVLMALGDGWVPASIAVGLAVILMQLTRTGHAPAGTDPLVVFALQPGWSFLMSPVFTGAVIIVVVALVFNNLRSDVRYPKYW